jgi:hypothetical protein
MFIFPGEVHLHQEHHGGAKHIVLSYCGRGICNHVSYYCGSSDQSAFGCATAFYLSILYVQPEQCYLDV